MRSSNQSDEPNDWNDAKKQVKFLIANCHENIGAGNCWRLVVLVIDVDSQIVHNRESSPKTSGDRSESPAPSLHLTIPNLEVETDQGGLKTKTKLISPLASPNNSRAALKIDDNHTGKTFLLTCRFRSWHVHIFSLLREGQCFGHVVIFGHLHTWRKNDLNWCTSFEHQAGQVT